MLHLCHRTKRVQPDRRVMQAQIQSQPWTPPDYQRLVWMVTARSRTQCLCEAFLEGKTICLWPQRKIQVENKYSSTSDDPISDNGLPYWLSPDYVWGPQRNNRAWQAKKCFVRGTLDFKEWMKEWVNEQMNRTSFLSRLAMFLLLFRGHLSAYSFVKCFLDLLEINGTFFTMDVLWQ